MKGGAKLCSWCFKLGEVNNYDPKNTKKYKFRLYKEKPKKVKHISKGGTHKNLMSKYLTSQLFEKLKYRVSNTGYTLSNVMQAGVYCPHLGQGVSAGDESCYYYFKELFDPMINEYHGHPPNAKHKSDLNPAHIKMTGAQKKKINKYAITARCRSARNFRGFPLMPGIKTIEMRHKIENTVMNALEKFTGSLKGKYYSLGKMSTALKKKYRGLGMLYQDPSVQGKTDLLYASGSERDWPVGRGFFISKDQKSCVWVGEEDHMRIVSMRKGGDIKAVFERFCKLSNQIKKHSNPLEFQFNDHLGFIGACPSNIGTGVRAGVMIKLPQLDKHLPEFNVIAAKLKLQVRGSTGVYTKAIGAKYDISNVQRLGWTEVQLVQKLIDGIVKIIDIEEKLAKGGDIKKLVKTVKAIK